MMKTKLLSVPTLLVLVCTFLCISSFQSPASVSSFDCRTRSNHRGSILANVKKCEDVSLALRAKPNDEGGQLESEFVLTRRDLLAQAVLAGVIFWKNDANGYPSFSDTLSGDVDGKVVLRTSSRNFPSNYDYLPTTKSVSSADIVPAGIDVRDSLTDQSQTFCDETDSESRRIQVFERVSPSVVYIDTYTAARDAFSTNIMEVPLGAGSGFVWDDRGHIVTNYHVVRNAQSAQVAILTRVFRGDESESVLSTNFARKQLNSPINQKSERDADVIDYTRKVYKAKVVGVDPDKDIAVLKVDAPVFDLHPIEVGTSNNLKVGQTALAIGNPFGLDHTLTVGVISGTGREVRSPNGRPISNTIQSDAAINPGNSGGPLLDRAGKLIGMNTAIYSPSGGSAGIGFAIPVDTLKYVVDTLIRDGRIVRPVIGISYLESKQARALGIKKGVLILDVPTTSPAFKAGLRGTKRSESGLIELGDIIVKVEDKPINTEADLFESLESFKPGDRIKITVNRVEVAPTNTRQPQMTEVTIVTQLKGSADAAPTNNFFIE